MIEHDGCSFGPTAAPRAARKAVTRTLAIAVWGALALPVAAVTPQQAVAELESTLDEPLRREGQAAPGLLAQMRTARVPGVSIAVIHQGRVHWVQGFGESAAGVPVGPGTRFQAASISKPLAALAALQLATDTGLSWDADLRPHLGGWVPPGDDGAPRYTLRRLLTHSAGLDVSGFPGYAAGSTLPSLRQVLEGQPPANTPAVKPVQPPGAFRYSGGGTSLVQHWMEQHARQDFAGLMQQRMLGPLGMADSHFGHAPREGAPAARYARGHTAGQPLPGGHHVYVEQAAAGLWTTPGDLAKLLLAMQAARRGDAGPIAPPLARATTTPGPVPHMGIGFFLSGDPGQLQHFGHRGLNAGFASQMLASLDGGEGVVVMANGEGEAGPVIDGIVRTLARVYGWPGGLQAPTLASSQALPPAAAQWAGDYPGFGPADAPPIRIRLAGDALWWARGPADWVRLSRMAGDGSYTTNGQHRFRFTDQHLELDGRRLARQAARPATWPTLYLRGSFNDWGTSTALQPSGPGRWQADISLPAGRHTFKLADAHWREVDLGGSDDTPVQPGPWHPLQGRGANLRLDTATAGRWHLELELADSPEPARIRWRAAGETPTRP